MKWYLTHQLAIYLSTYLIIWLVGTETRTLNTWQVNLVHFSNYGVWLDCLHSGKNREAFMNKEKQKKEDMRSLSLDKKLFYQKFRYNKHVINSPLPVNKAITSIFTMHSCLFVLIVFVLFIHDQIFYINK